MLSKNQASESLIFQAFLASLPVCIGYLAMGFAAGLLLASKANLDNPSLWGFFSSALCISGALQYVMVDWLCNLTALWQVAILTFCLNIRYGVYGLSLLESFGKLPILKKSYLIWALTDETYALELQYKNPDPQKYITWCLALSIFDHCYWVMGVTLGASIGQSLPFSSRGIEFSMTALFLVILTDFWRDQAKRIAILPGMLCSILALVLFGQSEMLIPALVAMLVIFIAFKQPLAKKMQELEK